MVFAINQSLVEYNATNRSLAGALAAKFAVRRGLEAVRIMSRYSNGAVKKLP